MSAKHRSGPREDSDIRREQIIDQTIRIIGERGFYGFTVQELAQRCGLSKAGLLHHFGSKHQLFVAVIEERERRESQIMAPIVARFQRRDARSGTSRATIVDLLRAIMQRVVEEPELGRMLVVLQTESLDPNHPAHTMFGSGYATVSDLFAKLITGYVPDPHATSRQIIAMMCGLELLWFRENQSFDLAAEGLRALTALIPGLAPGARTRRARTKLRRP